VQVFLEYTKLMSENIVNELNQIDSNSSFQARARSALDAVKKVGRGAGLALLFLFPNAAAAEQAPKNEPTIETLIEAYEKERTAIQPPAQNFKEHSVRIQQHDAIADVLNRLDYVGAREFVKKHTIGPGRGVNLDLPLDHGDNEKALQCLIHNAFREAGAERELASDWDLMVNHFTYISKNPLFSVFFFAVKLHARIKCAGQSNEDDHEIPV
jgi:hypothetical protein